MKPGFYVQAGAFSEINNAKRLEAQISHLGSVFINVANIAGQTFHRVRLGPFVKRSNAERLLDYIRNSGYSGARIFAE
jgi:rare lipoprotein A